MSRIKLRQADLKDDEFIIQLLNQESFIKNIGCRGVQSRQDAHNYIESAFLVPYRQSIPSPYIVEFNAQAIGICGFYQRKALKQPDLGYAFLDNFTGKGLAYESVIQALEKGKSEFGLSSVNAITDRDNQKSIRLLAKVGFTKMGLIRILPQNSAELLFHLKFRNN